jgi:hypothetical protein
MNIEMTEQDFSMLCSNSGPMGYLPTEQPHRFENMGPGKHTDPPRRAWRMGYWVDLNWTTVVLVKAYLTSNGKDFEVFHDMCFPDPELGGFVIFTDYVSDSWKDWL